ncbi:MAG: hypothetical protein WAM97_14525, partial [Acidimicrobiales bacterium]
GVSCTSADFCVAVGNYSTYEDAHVPSGSFAETWDGKQWTLTPDPVSSSMSGVSCYDSTHCFAAGFYGHPSVELWNGSNWTVIPTPTAVGGHEILPVDGHGVARWRTGELPAGGHQICLSD